MSTIATVNPYDGHPQLSQTEQLVLWEYAKLGDKIKRIGALAKHTAENPNEPLLADLRTLEKKMGLVLTLFRASVWAVIQDSQAEEEAAVAAEDARLREEEERERREWEESQAAERQRTAGGGYYEEEESY